MHIFQETHVTDIELQYPKNLNNLTEYTHQRTTVNKEGLNFNKQKHSVYAEPVTTDPEGRFIIITVSFNHTTFTLANVYVPNSDNPFFFHESFSSPNN